MTVHMVWMAINYVQVYQRGDPRLLADGTRVFVNQVGFGEAVKLMLNLLQHFAEEPALLPPGRRVVFVWSVRFANQIEPFVDTLQGIIQATASMPVSIRIFETGRKQVKTTAPSAVRANVEKVGFLTDPEPGIRDEPLPSPSDDHPLLERSFGREPPMSELPLPTSSFSYRVQTEPGRPPMAEILRCQDGEAPGDVTVYVCGPPPLVSDTEARCHTAGFVCHAETFLF